MEAVLRVSVGRQGAAWGRRTLTEGHRFSVCCNVQISDDVARRFSCELLCLVPFV